jgi:hypothetical protein
VPPVSSRDAGDYHAQLEKMRLCLLQNKKHEFYTAAERLSAIIDADRTIRRIEKRQIKTREDVVATEWMRYFVAIAPTIPEADFLAQAVRERYPYNEFDIEFKYSTFLSLYLISPEEYGEIERLLKKDIVKLKEIHLAYSAALIKGLRIAKKDSEKTRENFLEKSFPKDKNGRIGFPINNKKAEEKLRFIEISSAQMMSRSSRADIRSSLMYLILVQKLVDAFPKNAEMVQQYLLLTGCSKDECRAILMDKLIRTQETEHFFKGLPSPSQKSKSSKK